MSRSKAASGAVLACILLGACGSVNDFPLGGPNGGTTSPTEPNAGETTSNDAGVADVIARDVPETVQLARGVSGDR